MRYIVMADVHGNACALEDTLRDAMETYGDEIDGYIFAGDYVGDYPDGSKVVDMLRNLQAKNKVYIVKGNREAGQVDPYLKAINEGYEPNWSLKTTMGAALVCCRELKKDQLEYLSSLPETAVVRKEGHRPIFVKHKMPLNEEELKMVQDEKMVVITAHTHESHYEIYDGISQFNPGSVGLCDEGIPGANYGIIESDGHEWKFFFKHIDYDYRGTIESIKGNHKDLYEKCCGWGKALILSAETGVNCTSLYAFEAKKLAALKEEAERKGIEPDLKTITSIQDIYSQGRYGNVRYDGEKLRDGTIEENDEATVFEIHNVTTYDGRQVPQGTPTEEIYDIAYKNVETTVLNSNQDTLFKGRHEERKTR